MMMADFAVTCREDEVLLSTELRRRSLYSRVHTHTRPLDAPYLALAGPASRYAK